MCFGNAFGGNCTWILFIIVLILLCNDNGCGNNNAGLRLRLWLLIPFIWVGVSSTGYPRFPYSHKRIAAAEAGALERDLERLMLRLCLKMNKAADTGRAML